MLSYYDDVITETTFTEFDICFWGKLHVATVTYKSQGTIKITIQIDKNNTKPNRANEKNKMDTHKTWLFSFLFLCFVFFFKS
jgi:hypothetical protein